jgi:hypothetical protein
LGIWGVRSYQDEIEAAYRTASCRSRLFDLWHSVVSTFENASTPVYLPAQALASPAQTLLAPMIISA